MVKIIFSIGLYANDVFRNTFTDLTDNLTAYIFFFFFNMTKGFFLLWQACSLPLVPLGKSNLYKPTSFLCL